MLVFHYLYVNENVKKVVLRYEERRDRIRPYAVRKLKMKQCAVRNGEGAFTLMDVNINFA